jgi:hypothetical protein
MKHTFSMALGILVACGFAAPAVAAPNPCKLITQSEAARALGVAVLPAKPVPGGGNTECRYSNAAKNENVVVQVHDRVSEFPNVLLTVPTVTHVPQLGPKAVEYGNLLYMVTHGVYVTIGIYKGPNVKADADVIRLGKIAASRM